MTRASLSLLIAAVAVATLAAPAAHSQEATTPVFRAESELVALHVNVFDTVQATGHRNLRVSARHGCLRRNHDDAR